MSETKHGGCVTCGSKTEAVLKASHRYRDDKGMKQSGALCSGCFEERVTKQ